MNKKSGLSLPGISTLDIIVAQKVSFECFSFKFRVALWKVCFFLLGDTHQTDVKGIKHEKTNKRCKNGEKASLYFNYSWVK